ncbi:caspase family protein [Sphingomonas sp. CJ20]
MLEMSGASRVIFCGLLAVILAFFACVAPAGATPETSVSKVALIIANSKYEQTRPLANPAADAALIKTTLTALGFDTIKVVENGTRSGMETALRDFSVLADKADVAVIYYAGHGMEVSNTNYLIPVDARLARDRDAEMEAIKLDTLLQMTEGAKRLRIVILDACRNNPFDTTMVRAGGSRAASRGLAPIEPAGESLVVYAAKAGRTAADGSARNSPFARALARRLIEPGNEINLVFRKVRDDVLQETAGEQEPFTYGSLSSREFYFRPAAATASVAPTLTLDLEAEAWSLCRAGASRAPCDSYLTRYSKGKFADLARTRLADFSATSAAPAPVPAPEPARVAFPAEAVSGLGIRVRPSDDGAGIAVDAVDSRGLASGQLFPGDVIVAINTAATSRSASPATQLSGALGAQGRVKLLVKRGPSTAIVILRK